MRIIEILIALVLVYAILSILVSILREWYSSMKKERGTMLRSAIYQMLNDSLNHNYGYLLMNHPLVSSMKNPDGDRPFQYLDSGIFADALIDIIGDQAFIDKPVKGKKKEPDEIDLSAMEVFRQGLDKMNRSPFRKMLFMLYDKSDGQYDKLKKSLEIWYDANMERTTGWYKRKQQKKLLIFGFAIAIFLNIDSIHLVRVISMDEELRTNLVNVAEGVADRYDTLSADKKEDPVQLIQVVKNEIAQIDTTTIDSASRQILLTTYQKIDKFGKKLTKSDSIGKLYLKQTNELIGATADLGIPIGWNCDIAPLSWFKTGDTLTQTEQVFDEKMLQKNRLLRYTYKRNSCGKHTWGYALLYVLGIMITGFMLSFGATFWFDLLVKLVNIRRAGIKPLDKNKPQKS